MSEPTLDNWRALACAVVIRAHKDAVAGNGHSFEARSWLAGDGARWLVALLDDLDVAGLGHALARLPSPTYEQLALLDLLAEASQ